MDVLYLFFGCTWMDAALPASGSEVDAIPVPCPSRTITIRKVLCSSIPGKLFPIQAGGHTDWNAYPANLGGDTHRTALSPFPARAEMLRCTLKRRISDLHGVRPQRAQRRYEEKLPRRPWKRCQHLDRRRENASGLQGTTGGGRVYQERQIVKVAMTSTASRVGGEAPRCTAALRVSHTR
jgi:hypothetical protein